MTPRLAFNLGAALALACRVLLAGLALTLFIVLALLLFFISGETVGLQ